MARFWGGTWGYRLTKWLFHFFTCSQEPGIGQTWIWDGRNEKRTTLPEIDVCRDGYSEDFVPSDGLDQPEWQWKQVNQEGAVWWGSTSL